MPGDPAREILIQTPNRRLYGADTTNAVREMVTKGASGGTLFFNTDDASQAHPRSRARRRTRRAAH